MLQVFSSYCLQYRYFSLNSYATNQHVVAYNKLLLHKYQSHINVEIISNLRVLKYLYKYLFKGFNRALLETIERTAVDNGTPRGDVGAMTATNNILYPKGLNLPKGVLLERDKQAKILLTNSTGGTTDDNGQNLLVYDEVQMVEDLRAVTSCEAAWETSAYPMNGSSHIVATCYIHEPNGETLIIPKHQEEEVLHRLREDHNEIPSMLKAWFHINSHPPNERIRTLLQELTFRDMPKYFTYKKPKWIFKQRTNEDRIVCRVESVHPRYLEKFAIRLLAMNKKFIRNFEELKTVDGELCPTFADAATKMGLMTNEREWHLTMEDAIQTEMPINIRRLFASILVFCAPADPRLLWDMYKKEARALFHIRSILRHHNFELNDFYLPDVNKSLLGHDRELVDDGSEMYASYAEIQSRAASLLQDLNTEQESVYREVMQERNDINGRRLFFIEGSGGCGKTFLYESLYYGLRAQGHKVLSVAHTGVAATLLPNGSTVHRAFGIPLTTEEDMQSHIDLASHRAEELKQVDVVLWDESTMSDRRVYNCVDRLLRALHDEADEEAFGGVMIIAGGDWKQTLPIVPEARGQGVLDYTLKQSTLWPHFKHFSLKTNMRAITDSDYADFILQVGSGEGCDDQDRVAVPRTILYPNENEVLNFVFPNDGSSWSNRSILTPTNEVSLELANKNKLDP
ncbi:hypothetical protein L596_011651 [Steinernema carpocapsae]|uniref:ATP-dependent DNA helicase n=1 Tax=Steinernema carpocapsae TaxID=34508 RepID=A0A4U5NV06_STECR|nr:hypothetical protein L596_011651 [Steinernema carpocapsae]